MNFADTLLSTMVGALAGAVVGALAAWLFALDLRRRDKADRDQERTRAQEARKAERDEEHKRTIDLREQQRTDSYEDRLEAQLARVIELLYEYGLELDKLPPDDRKRAGRNATSPSHQARSRLLGVLRGTMMMSNAKDFWITSSAWTATCDLPSGRPREMVPIESIAGALEVWRRSDTMSTLDVLQRFNQVPRGPLNARPEDSAKAAGTAD